jgi:hypothetical protein
MRLTRTMIALSATARSSLRLGNGCVMRAFMPGGFIEGQPGPKQPD